MKGQDQGKGTNNDPDRLTIGEDFAKKIKKKVEGKTSSHNLRDYRGNKKKKLKRRNGKSGQTERQNKVINENESKAEARIAETKRNRRTD